MLRSCGLTTPMQFGPQRAIPASRQMPAISSWTRRPSAPASPNPPSKMTTAPTRRSAASFTCSSAWVWPTQKATASTSAGSAEIDG